ncbi:hypothetical protein GCM10020219_044000 [Nonomuraea dietziae]
MAMEAGTSEGSATMTTSPTGTLTKNAHSQPGPAVSSPPTSTPTAAPVPPIAAQTASALVRRSPWKAVVMVASAAGDSSAAPTPCSARPAMSVAPSGARPHSSEASVNRASPPSSTRRAPKASVSRPPSTINPPKHSV